MPKTAQSEAFRAWLKNTPRGVLALLANRLNTTQSVLRQYTAGVRNVSAARALEIEHAVEELKQEGVNVPPLTAPDLCAACANCHYANKD